MFADLNLPHEPNADAQVHRERLALAARLGASAQRASVACRGARLSQHPQRRAGFSQVATVQLVDAAALGDAHVREPRAPTHAALAPHARAVCASQRCTLRPVDDAALQSAAAGPAEASQPLLSQCNGDARLVQHTRLTVVATEPAHCAQLAAAGDVTRSYDILAVQAASERVFASACTTLDVDIISFDLARRLPFRLRVPAVRAALGRGITFELCYSPALREPNSRRQLFTNALAVVRATGGAGVILSSGAQRAFELRGPHDVANLGTLFGLSLAAAKAAVSTRMVAVLQHAAARRAPSFGRQVLPLAAQPENRVSDDAHAWPPRPTDTLAARQGEPASRADEADAAFLAF